MIASYASIRALGHKEIEDILKGWVVVEEKVDGSQFSFGLIDGELQARSNGKQIVLDAPEKMFTKAVASVQALKDRGALVPGWIYRGEYLSKPKHNTLCYGRVPAANIIIFDIETGPGAYLPPLQKFIYATRSGLECVPLLWQGDGEHLDPEMWREFLAREAYLGNCQVEGVVVKNYNRFTEYGSVMMAKLVSTDFKEKHAHDWKLRNPSQGDVVEKLIAELRTEARWRKAVQHLDERGELQHAPQDIGPFLKEIAQDVLKEEEDYIKEALWKHCWPKIQRGISAGAPEWYKQQLAERVFATE